jgi:hypothetical protein
MIRLGTALKSTEFPYHRCVVLSNPQSNGGQVLLVRITSDDGTWPERRTMKTRVTQRRIRAPKHSACALCKPQKRGWEDKRTPRDRRLAEAADEQLKDRQL